MHAAVLGHPAFVPPDRNTGGRDELASAHTLLLLLHGTETAPKTPRPYVVDIHPSPERQRDQAKQPVGQTGRQVFRQAGQTGVPPQAKPTNQDLSHTVP